MKTVQLLAVAYPALTVLALAPSVPVLSVALCLVALLVTGELWLRALVREPLTPTARLGLVVTAGLISLPLIALVLNVLGVRIEGRWLAAGLAVLAGALGAYARVSTTTSLRPSAAGNRRPDRTALAVGVPALLAILVGGSATLVYQRLPHPAEPGYTSLALAGWAAGIAHPVVVPAGGLEVPLEVTSAGERPGVADLLVQVGGRPAGPGTPVSIVDGTRSVRVHVPAPPDDRLHAIRISLGPASTVFYGCGPGPVEANPAQANPTQANPTQGGPAHASPAQGGPAQGGPAQGGPAQGGPAQGGTLRGGTAQDGAAQGGAAQDGTGPDEC